MRRARVIGPHRYRLLFLAFAFVTASPLAARAQTADTLRGTVTTDSGVPIVGAEVVATRAPDRAFKSALTDNNGRYHIVFEQGTGDYLLHVSALGRVTVRIRVKRNTNEAAISQDVQLKSSIQQLETVTVSAEKEKPQREHWPSIEPGEAGKLSDGVYGAVPPDAQGNLAAIVSTTPGVSLTPGGISVLGIDPSQNQTTLNGMAFAGADVPRSAQMNTRVSSSTYDPARGWFEGAEIRAQLTPGSVYTRTNLRFFVEAPAFQYGDRISAISGQRFTSLTGSMGNSGSFAADKYNYSLAFEGGHRSSAHTSLERAGPDLLQQTGLSRDSADRLVGILSAAGIPVSRAGSGIGNNTDYLSFIGRVDHAETNYTTGQPEKQTWGLLGYAKVRRSSALELMPTALAMHGGENTQRIGTVQASYSSYLHDRDYLTEATTALNVKMDRTNPYLRLPNGVVLVTSDFPDLPGAVTPVLFGGNSLRQDTRDWTWETNSVTSFYASRKAQHRVLLTADSRIDGLALSSPFNTNGTFVFNSLADLATNTPASFTRTLAAPSSNVRVWNAFASLGDYWRKSRTFQLLYGARLEGDRFLDHPPYNPEINRLFGVRNDRTPASIHVSPRIGFTWIRVPAGEGIAFNGIGQFNIGSPSYFKGGVGEFRGLLAPRLLTRAMTSTGRPGAERYLTCIGPGSPIPDWTAYEADPATIPGECVSGSGVPTPFADAAPSVVLLDKTYQPARSWRGNLSYASRFRSLLYTVEGIYSLNLNQPGITDLNFNGVPRFLTDEGRPVYASARSIDAASGIASTVETRSTPSFGAVLLNRSDLRSISRQVTLTISPPPENTRAWYGSLGYTLGSNRALASGFDAPTFNSPLRREWSRGNLDARHQFKLQGGRIVKGVSITFYGNFQSGLPFTPIVGGDVNGDGLINDRAYIFNPSAMADSALRADLDGLLSRSSDRIRNCVTQQFGTAAKRNSCEGPWTANLNMQVQKNFEIPRAKGRYATVALAVANPLGGLDQLLHGSAHLHGWGSFAFPDSRLYTVSGFDTLAHKFEYVVNPRFGDTRPTNFSVRAPFRVTLDVSLNLGPPAARQQLERLMGPGRTRPGNRLTSDDLKRRYRRNVNDPYAAVLEESDSLLLTPAQEEALKVAQTDYLRGVDSLWSSLTEYLARLGRTFDAKEAVRRQEETTDAAWAFTQSHVKKTLGTILSPVQIELSGWPGFLYKSTGRISGRTYSY